MAAKYQMELPETGKIDLEWGMYAIKLFCERKGIAVDDFSQTLAAMVNPEGWDKKEAYDCTIGFLMAGYEAANDKKVSEKEVCGWIDEMGGLMGLSVFISPFVNFVVANTLTQVTPLPGDKEEKKNEPESQPLGMI